MGDITVGLDIEQSSTDYLLIQANKQREFKTLADCIRYTNQYKPKHFLVRLRLNKEIQRGFVVYTNPVDVKALKKRLECTSQQLADHLKISTARVDKWCTHGVPYLFKHLFEEFRQ